MEQNSGLTMAKVRDVENQTSWDCVLAFGFCSIIRSACARLLAGCAAVQLWTLGMFIGIMWLFSSLANWPNCSSVTSVWNCSWRWPPEYHRRLLCRCLLWRTAQGHQCHNRETDAQPTFMRCRLLWVFSSNHPQPDSELSRSSKLCQVSVSKPVSLVGTHLPTNECPKLAATACWHMHFCVNGMLAS